MPAPKGNRFWLARSSRGRNPIFADADELWAACCEYFDWVDDNPLSEAKLFAYQGEVKTGNLPKMRAMTLEGLCIFLDIARQSWDGYRERDGFAEVTARVENAIRTQKFEGAAADLFNPTIIARALGLADRSEPTGPDREALQHRIEMDAERFTSAMADMAAKSGAAGGD
jgi:hypothetical protein